MGNRSPGYAGPKRHGFSSAFTEPARGKTLAEVTEPCPTCGQLCTLDTYETTINDQRYRVTVFHCPSEKSRRSKNPKIQAQACPRYQRKEKIDVPVLTTSEAAEIRHKAETAGLKIVDLSRRAGMGGSTLGNVLAGRQKIQEAALERVHDVLATAGGGSTVGKQVPSMAQDLLKMHPDNRDRVLGPVAEQALPHYNGCPPTEDPCLSRIEAIESRLGHAIKGSESVVREFSNRLTSTEEAHQSLRDEMTQRVGNLEHRAKTQHSEFAGFRDFTSAQIDELAKSSEIQDAQLTTIEERVSYVIEDGKDSLTEIRSLDQEFRKLVGTVTGIDNNLVEARNKITELGGMMRSSDEAFATRLNRMGEMIASQAETSRSNADAIGSIAQIVQDHAKHLKDHEARIIGHINSTNCQARRINTIEDRVNESSADPDRIAALEAVASVHCGHRATLSDPNGDHVLWRELRRLNGALESVQERLHDQAGDQADAAARVEFFTLALQAQAARLTILESRPAKNPALVRRFERVAQAVAEQDPGQFTAVVERLLGVTRG